ALVRDSPVAVGRPTPATPEVPPFRCDPYATFEYRFGLLHELLALPRNEAADRLISPLNEAGLRGMGGARFPTPTKWEFVRKQPRLPKYVICNADESEPGTFKDREILYKLSHLVVEGMILAGLGGGADYGIMFIRHEYALERGWFEQAVQHARELG